MPMFQYTARTLKGALQQGEIDLPSRDDVIAHLRKNRMGVGQVRPAAPRGVVSDGESGHTLADSLRKHPKAFSDLYVNMVAAGEAGGILDTILQRLANYIEKNVKLIGQGRPAMIYPLAG